MPSSVLRIFRKWNRILHRDIGYFFFGMTLIYAISGIALNHKKDWNPNYHITNEDIVWDGNLSRETMNEAKALEILKKFHEDDHYKKFYFPDDNTVKIFIDNGSVTIDMETGEGYLEKITRRAFFYELNFLHYNPGKWWLWFSDSFCVGLLLIAITGLFVIPKSKNSLSKRGWWFVAAGLLAPILALVLF